MTKTTLPVLSKKEVVNRMVKSDTIHLRVTKAEKELIRANATGLHLSITDYLLKCHEVVSAKLEEE